MEYLQRAQDFLKKVQELRTAVLDESEKLVVNSYYNA